MTHPFTYRQFLIYGLLALGVSLLLKACGNTAMAPSSPIEGSSADGLHSSSLSHPNIL